MSHFLTGVIIPKNTENEESTIEELLADYSEGLEVQKYDRPCYCIGNQAQKEAREETERQLGTFDALREKYNAMPENDRPEWKDHIKAYIELEDKLKAEHPLAKSPDPECEECHGVGTYKSRYNPQSKWDWYEVGGRWTGAFSDYDPYKDEKNFKECWLCKGTGKRDDEIGRQARKENPKYGCNACNSTGKEYDSYNLPDIGNRTTTDELAKNLKDKTPYAIVTPEGEWIERGQMGWWGISSGDKDQDVWDKQVKEILNKYSGHTIVAVDCHI